MLEGLFLRRQNILYFSVHMNSQRLPVEMQNNPSYRLFWE